MSRARQLVVSPGLSFPIDAVTETFWWLGIRGSGKTHDCSVFVEEMLDAGAQVIVLDPMHAWWGLRSSASGTDTGYPIPIFGGPRGDVPLEPGAGKFMAELAVTERVSMILDIKRWSKADRRRFVTDFLGRLLEANDRSPLHVVLEEAPLFAPQRPQRDETVMLGIVEEFVRLGRGEGLGCSLISQRSATINKEVSTQTEVLVAHRVRSPQDVKAVEAWFDVHDPDAGREATKRLAHLPTGTAIVTSTSFLDHFGEITFRPRRTFDSSSTPKVGQVRREARTLADVDLDAVKDAMAETIERVKADDPKELRRRIVSVEADNRALRSELENRPPVEPVTIEVPVLDEDLVIRLEETLQPAAGLLAEVQERLSWEVTRRNEMIEFTRRLANDRRPAPAGERPRVPDRPSAPRSPGPAGPDGALGKGEQRILAATAQHRTGVTREQLTVLTGYKRSSRDTYLQRLRSRDLIAVAGDTITATTLGVETLGDDFEPLPTGRALRDHWLRTLPEGERRILAELLDAYPDGVDRDVLSTATGYKRSSRDTYLQRLRSRQLVTTDGAPRAADVLFEEQ